MRYLLVFHAEATAEWRCLDTARLGSFISSSSKDIPNALRAAPEITLSWMLGRRRFGALRSSMDSRAEGAEWVRVYDLSVDSLIIGEDHGYQGAWLDMLMQEKQPIGWIPAFHLPAACPALKPGIFVLKARAADPLRSENGVCQKTMEKVRTQLEALPYPQPSTDRARHVVAPGTEARKAARKHLFRVPVPTDSL